MIVVFNAEYPSNNTRRILKLWCDLKTFGSGRFRTNMSLEHLPDWEKWQ